MQNDDLLLMEVEDEEWEPLGEMATIATSTIPQLRIQVNPDRNRKGNPYFKVYDHARIIEDGTKVVRLSFFSSKIIHHKDQFEDWKISEKDIKSIHTLMNKANKEYHEYTNWQVTKFKWNQEYGFLTLDDIDEYLDGAFDEKFKDHPSYVPSTTVLQKTWIDEK